jgi:hypothetical protein
VEIRNHRLQSLLHSPECNIAVFAFLLNFFWEVQQMPFFQLPPELSCQARVYNCTWATLGDVGIALLAFWTVAALALSRQWLRHPKSLQVGVFVFVGILVTVVFEFLATGLLDLWQYADIMPVIPLLGTGLLPFLQWIIVPLLTICFARKQLA